MPAPSRAFQSSLADLLAGMIGAFALVLITLSAGSAPAQTHVGSGVCADCHDDQAGAWAGSHHALAWTPADPANIVADFDNTRFDGEGMQVRFAREGEGFTITVTEADGTETTYPVHSVAGIEPLQQYLLETEPGRLQSFDVVWDTEAAQWVHLYPGSDLDPADGLHWTGPYKTWNARCAECHATDYSRSYRRGPQSYASTAAEIGVGCESCHGPGSAHVDWAQDPAKPMPPKAGFSIDLTQAGTEAQIQNCAGCHSRRENFTDGNPLPGTPYHDSYRLALLRPGLYHADGQILDEVYVYGSFLQSKMYAQGVGCLNCHDPHTAQVKADDNSLCTQCHSPAGNPDFPTLKLAEYDTPTHHFHPEGSPGAQCKSCHMIERTYMVVDGRRDHSFRIPRPDLAAETGGPDACTDCHADQTPDWAAAQIAKHHPDPTHRGPHYGQVLARGRADPVAAAGDLASLASDMGQPGIVRATALYLMQGAGAVPDAALLSDPDPLVRAEAASALQPLPDAERAAALTPLLTDPVRAVRIAAARQMVGLPATVLRPSQIAVMREALGDWQRSLSNKLDFPETHLVLGGLALSGRNVPAALAAFREVVRMDPQRADAWVMLVRITHASQGLEPARQVLREALGQVPEDPALIQLRSQMGG